MRLDLSGLQVTRRGGGGRRDTKDEDLSPLTFGGMRYALAAIVLVGVVVARPARRAEVTSLDAPTVLRLCLLGLVFISLTQGAQFVAIDNQPAATTSLVLSLTPLLVALQL